MRDLSFAEIVAIESPSFAPNGRELVFSGSDKGGLTDLYVVDLEDAKPRALSRDLYHDRQPAWSPDGKSIIFTSGRSGQPQIYQIPAEGGRAVRLTFEGKYNARASYSPDGTKIVVVHSADKGFQIAILELKTKEFKVLTQSRLNESPSFAPNGSMILYATTDSGGPRLAAISVDGRVKQSLQVKVGGVREPAWSPFKTRN